MNLEVDGATYGKSEENPNKVPAYVCHLRKGLTLAVSQEKHIHNQFTFAQNRPKSDISGTLPLHIQQGTEET